MILLNEQLNTSFGSHDSIQKCDANLRRDLYSKVVLSGGNTMFPGISAPLQKELSLLAPHGTGVTSLWSLRIIVSLRYAF